MDRDREIATRVHRYEVHMRILSRLRSLLARHKDAEIRSLRVQLEACQIDLDSATKANAAWGVIVGDAHRALTRIGVPVGEALIVRIESLAPKPRKPRATAEERWERRKEELDRTVTNGNGFYPDIRLLLTECKDPLSSEDIAGHLIMEGWENSHAMICRAVSDYARAGHLVVNKAGRVPVYSLPEGS